MVEHGDDQELITENAIDHRKRKPAKQYPTAIADNERVPLGVAHGSGDWGIQSPGELKAETRSARLVPRLRLQRLVSGLWPKENAHSVIALEQFSADQIPWHGTPWILFMLSQSCLNCLQLIRRQSHRFGAFRSDAVPNIFRELDPLSNGEAKEIRSGLAHGRSIDRRPGGGPSLLLLPCPTRRRHRSQRRPLLLPTTPAG